MIKIIENIDLNKDYLDFKLEGITQYALFSMDGLEESDGYDCKSYHIPGEYIDEIENSDIYDDTDNTNPRWDFG